MAIGVKAENVEHIYISAILTAAVLTLGVTRYLFIVIVIAAETATVTVTLNIANIAAIRVFAEYLVWLGFL